MFRKLTRLALLCSLLILTGALAARADSISFDSSSYSASASAYYGSEEAEPDDVTHKSLPIFTTIDHSASVTNASATAGASDSTNLTNLYATASATAPDAYAYSSMWAEFTFTATFPQIKISYDYSVSLTASPGDLNSAYGGINVCLLDKGGVDIPVQYLDETGSGTLDIDPINLITGNVYVLHFGTLPLEAVLGEGLNASATVTLSDIQVESVQAVPLPPSLFLLGAGLLGLWGLRRRPPH